MKKGIIISTFLFALLTQATAQNVQATAPASKATKDTSRQSDYTVILTASVGEVWYHQVPGITTFSFPYTIQPNGTNLIAKETFSASAKNFYSGALIPVDIFNMEFLPRNNIGVRTAIGVVSAPAGEKNDAFYFRMGTYYSMPIRLGTGRKKPQWFFRPGIDGLLVLSSGGAFLGKIINSNATVQLPSSLTSGPQFSSTDGDGDQSGPYTTKYLNVYLNEVRGALIPKLTLAFQPKWIFFASLDAGWLVPIYNRQSMEIYQEDGAGDNNDLGNIAIKHNPVTVAVNSQPVGRAPSINGLYLALNVGVSFPHYPKPRTGGTNDNYYDGGAGWFPGGGGGAGGGHSTPPVAPSGGGGGGGGHHG